jgi:hypothetical protein
VTPEEFRTEAGRRLAAAGYAVEETVLPGGPAVVGRRKPFRVQWLLTQLKVSVVVTAVERITADGWQRFAADAFQLAKSFRGGLPTGLQSGIGAVPVLAARQVDPYAVALATQPPRTELFTGIAMPALVDLVTGAVHENNGAVLVGGIYAKFLRKQRSIVTGIVRP